MTATEAAATVIPTERDVVGKLVARLRDEHFGTGPLAELRRMNPDPSALAAAPPSLHRMLARHVPDNWLHGGSLGRWALLVHLLALAAPSPPGKIPKLGEALFAAGYNEGRLTSLLQTTPGTFPVVLPRMVRFLVVKQAIPDPYQLAGLVLRGGDEADRVAIARAFYRAEAKAEA